MYARWHTSTWEKLLWAWQMVKSHSEENISSRNNPTPRKMWDIQDLAKILRTLTQHWWSTLWLRQGFRNLQIPGTKPHNQDSQVFRNGKSIEEVHTKPSRDDKILTGPCEPKKKCFSVAKLTRQSIQFSKRSFIFSASPVTIIAQEKELCYPLMPHPMALDQYFYSNGKMENSIQ